MGELRTVILHVDDTTKQVSMKDLHAGDIFTLYESDNTQVGKMWKATSEPKLQESVWGIICEPLGETNV